MLFLKVTPFKFVLLNKVPVKLAFSKIQLSKLLLLDVLFVRLEWLKSERLKSQELNFPSCTETERKSESNKPLPGIVHVYRLLKHIILQIE